MRGKWAQDDLEFEPEMVLDEPRLIDLSCEVDEEDFGPGWMGCKAFMKLLDIGSKSTFLDWEEKLPGFPERIHVSENVVKFRVSEVMYFIATYGRKEVTAAERLRIGRERVNDGLRLMGIPEHLLDGYFDLFLRRVIENRSE
jgi:hypothetical protein